MSDKKLKKITYFIVVSLLLLGFAPDVSKAFNLDDLMAEYYIRLTAVDKPGVMARISGALGDHGVSIAMLLQKLATENGNAVIVIKTHDIRTRQLNDALKTVDGLDIVNGPSLKIRILDPLSANS